MPKTASKEVRIKLPKAIADGFTSKELIGLLADKALNKYEYYSSRCKEMEEKYGTDFASFKKRVEESEEENFAEWDDLMSWEAYELSCSEWKTKYGELTLCTE